MFCKDLTSKVSSRELLPALLNPSSMFYIFAACTRSYDIAFVLDLSGSLYDVYALGMEIIRQIVYGLEFRFDRSRAALVLYSDTSYVRFYLNTYQDKSDILQALSVEEIGGRTNTQAALQMVLDQVFISSNGDRGNVENKVVLITDGGSNIQENETIQKATNLKNNGGRIYVVAVGDKVNMNEVNSMASEERLVYRVYNTGDITTQADALLQHFC